MKSAAPCPCFSRAGWIVALFALANGANAADLNIRSLRAAVGTESGAGAGFQRGADCLVVTAEHVIAKMGTKVSVLDRTGASTTADVVWRSETDTIDLALLSFPASAEVRCSGRWSDARWMTTHEFGVGDEFHVLREKPDGSQELFPLRWAGSAPTRLVVSPTDSARLQASDSGSLVMMDKRPVGIVLQVQDGGDRYQVLRMDTISELVGERFGSGAENVVTLEQVEYQGRDSDHWRAYVGTWFSVEGAPTLAEPGYEAANCRIGVKVLSFSEGSQGNPEVEAARRSLASCRTNPLTRNSSRLVEACESSARHTIQNEPHRLAVTSLQMEVAVVDANGRQWNNLGSRQFARNPDISMPRADVELHALRETFGSLASPLLQEAGCMRPVPQAPPKKRSLLRSLLLGE